MTEDPTLKIRLTVNGLMLGQDCTALAERIVGPAGEVLDAKWGRQPKHWSGRGDWGRGSLTEREKGFIEAIEMAMDSTEIERHLVSIIQRLAR